MKSRVGKNTNHMYLAFHDKEKDKHQWVESKVAKFIGKKDEEGAINNDDEGIFIGKLNGSCARDEDHEADENFMLAYMP